VYSRPQVGSSLGSVSCASARSPAGTAPAIPDSSFSADRPTRPRLVGESPVDPNGRDALIHPGGVAGRSVRGDLEHFRGASVEVSSHAGETIKRLFHAQCNITESSAFRIHEVSLKVEQ
jgi:hypothetical protein